MGMLPFCKGTVVLPRQRRAAMAGMALAAPSRPPVVRAHRALAATVATVGARWFPPARSVWPHWLGDEEGAVLLEDLERSIGRIDAVALHVPRQAGRRSLAVVALRDEVPVAFVKVKPDGVMIDLETSALAALADGGPDGLRVPRPIARGCVGVHWLATTVINGPHEPDYEEPTAEYEAWLDDRLRPVLMTAGPAHWTPAHGDLAPWNLRRRSGAAWLLDWESPTFAPPGADRTYFSAACAVLLGRNPVAAPDEAVDYWLAKVGARADSGDPLNRRLLQVLPRMREPA
jgi:hypothetical protein